MVVQPRLQVFAYVVAVAAVIGGLIWGAFSGAPHAKIGAPQADYYTLLVRGFLKGQLSLDVRVDPRVLACPDPYDPALRPDSALHDASLYEGRYYIYQGVVPAALLLLPFRAVTGTDLPMPYAVLVFAAGAYLMMVIAFEAVRRRAWPELRGIPLFLSLVAMGATSWLFVLVRRGSMYELPIASGVFFGLAGINAALRAASDQQRQRTWLVAAGTAWALAVGCRPTWLFAAAATLVVLVWAVWRTEVETGHSRRWASVLIPVAVPVVLIGAALAWYNHARFGSLTEFGVRYILSGVYESRIEHFHIRYLAWNALAYLWSPVGWSSFFPFLHELSLTASRPAQHFGIDHAFGVLRYVPFLWLAAFPLWRLRRYPDVSVRVAVASLALGAAAMAVVLFCFYAAMSRYLADVLPFLAVLAAFGAADLCQGRSWLGRGWRTLFVALVTIWSSAVAWLFSAQIYGIWRRNNPASFERASAVFDAPVHLWRRLGGHDGARGVAEFSLQLPLPVQPGVRELLLQTGAPGQTDRVFIRYTSATQFAVEFEHDGASAVASEPMAMAGVHRVRVRLGSLLPPGSWPGYRLWPQDVRTRAVRSLRIDVDGRTVLRRQLRFHPSSPDQVRVASGQAGDFSGRVLEVLRPQGGVDEYRDLGFATHGGFGPDAGGAWRLRVRFPEAPAAAREPLLVSGESGRADFLVVEYLGAARCRLLLDHWGKPPRYSPEFPFEPGRAYLIELSHPAYAGTYRQTPEMLRVRIDGTELWSEPVVMYPANPDDCHVGVNPIGGSSSSARFSGQIEAP